MGRRGRPTPTELEARPGIRFEGAWRPLAPDGREPEAQAGSRTCRPDRAGADQSQKKSAAGQLIPTVKNVVAVASGKGGVGKSTTRVNLALALAEIGAKVGLLDADIYGPNLPLMMGIKERPPLAGAEGRIEPVRRYGIKMMSIGFFLDENNPVIWRGPMVHGAIQQLLRDVD